jgi:pimeloyl-ACP methyl ester carboxylesterase
VSHLALVDSVAFGGWPRRDLRIARAWLGLTGRTAPRWMLAVLRADLERGYEAGERAAHSIERFLRPFASAEGRDAFAQHLRALDARETRAMAGQLGAITAPTTVIWGSGDPFVSAKLGRRLADAIPGASLELVPGARHFTPEDAPRPVADALAALLAR